MSAFRRTFVLFIICCAKWVVAGEDSMPAPSPLQLEIRDLWQRAWAAKKASAPPGFLAGFQNEFDALARKYPDGIAEVDLSRANFQQSILDDEEAAMALYASVVQRFPGSKPAEQAARLAHRLSPAGKAERAAQLAAEQARREALLGQPAPELTGC